jgi:hypothetical protein
MLKTDQNLINRSPTLYKKKLVMDGKEFVYLSLLLKEFCDFCDRPLGT